MWEDVRDQTVCLDSNAIVFVIDSGNRTDGNSSFASRSRQSTGKKCSP
jgi:hypothetical protein